MIRAVIVEDEPLAARYLCALLESTGKVLIVGEARNGRDGLLICGEESPDAAFLDVRLPGPDGVALAAHLLHLPHPPLLVFTTGHADRAADAFRVDAVDYLLKPLDPDHIAQAVCRIEARLAGRHPDQDAMPDEWQALGLQEGRLSVKSENDVAQLLSRWDIVLAIRHHRRTWIHTTSGEFATYNSLDALHHWLGDAGFLRVSREAILNLQAIEQVIHYGDRLYRIRMRDRLKTCIEASRSGATRIAAMLKAAV